MTPHHQRAAEAAERAHRETARLRRLDVVLPADVPGARWIILSQGAFALVDADVYAELNQYNWCKSVAGYAIRAGKPRGVKVFLHCEVLRKATGEVDHRDGNKLDCRRQNLRSCTHAQNTRNQKKCSARAGKPTSSKYKGVTWYRGRWNAQIGGRVPKLWHLHLGRFATELEAALAYDAAAREHFGEFARCNFPERTVAA